jgi:2,5-furandicarboxylate decarboxylase 1
MVRINPDGKTGIVTKVGIDATAPYPRTQKLERVSFREINLKNYEIEE